MPDRCVEVCAQPGRLTRFVHVAEEIDLRIAIDMGLVEDVGLNLGETVRGARRQSGGWSLPKRAPRGVR